MDHGPSTMDFPLINTKQKRPTNRVRGEKREARSETKLPEARGKKLQINYLKYFKNSNTQGYTWDQI